MTETKDTLHEEIQNLIPAYAIGATDPEESARVEAHLRECEECRALFDEYTRLADNLLYTVPLVAAPASLEERLMAQIAAPQPRAPRHDITLASQPRRSRFAFPRLSAWAAAIAVVLLLITNAFWMARFQKMEQQVAVQATALAFLVDAPEVPLSGDTPAPNARGVLVLRPDANIAVLHLDHLPPLPEGKAYQVWLIRNGKRDSGAVFRVQGQGEVTVLVRAPHPLGEYEALGITIEPAGGSPSPTGPRVIKGQLRNTS